MTLPSKFAAILSAMLSAFSVGGCATSARFDQTTAGARVSASDLKQEATEVLGFSGLSHLSYVRSTLIPGDNCAWFTGNNRGIPAVSANGRIAAIKSCDKLLIVDLENGRVLQSAPANDFKSKSVVTFASDDDVELFAVGGNDFIGVVNGFFHMSSKIPMSRSGLDIPAAQSGGKVFAVAGYAQSPDGRILAMDFVEDGNAKSNTIRSVYDLESEQRIRTTVANPDGLRTFADEITKNRNRYTLWSKRFRGDSPAGFEAVELNTGTTEVLETHDSETMRPEHTWCGIAIQQTANPGELGFVVTFRDGSRITLNNLRPNTITSCTVSKGGQFVFVSVPPYVHAFSVKR